MKLIETPQYLEARAGLPGRIQRLLRVKLSLLMKDATYPSLNVHRCRCADGTWMCYVDRKYRLLYRYGQGDTLVLLDTGSHGIIDRIRKKEHYNA